MMKRMIIVTAAVLCATAASAQQQAAGQQQRPLRPNRPAVQGRGQGIDEGRVTPAEIQRMFDAYALVQAQEQLKLDDEQYSRFLIKYKALQDSRRQAIQEHTRVVTELRRLLMQAQTPEGDLKEQMQALREADARAVADARKAFDAVDQVLDLRQQAMFRVFEEQMERRKLELVTRARQVNRANQAQ
jgi:hypothetical protein